MFLIKLAVKNLIRHHVRTIITAGIIAFAIFFYILLDSLILGMTDMSYKSIIDYQAGHMQIVNKEYWEDKDKLPLEHLIKPDSALIEKIISAEGFKAYSPELDIKAMLNNGMDELPVTVKAVRPDKFLDVYPIEDKFVEGSMCRAGEYKAVMGKELAELMKLEVGDYIILLFRDKNETYNTMDLEISGLIHTPNPNLNNNTVIVPSDIAGAALSTDNAVSRIIVRLDNKNLAAETGKTLKSQTDNDLGVYIWSELDAVSVAGAKNMGNSLVLIIILLIAGIAIINTVILAALERMEEIGMMKAMGLEEREIIFTFVMESTGIGLLGGIIGIILGFFGALLLVNVGMDWSAMLNMDMTQYGIPVIGTLYGSWNPRTFIQVFLFGVIVSMLSSILPAWWAAKKDPVKAIYHR
ncbi:MAG: FtsX-like permease family protein [candidate division WOR-3 bacterium]|nr:FtsX-like permease family protein [candidate division WOR-3 bacterium]